jgi:hypothetical protein
MTNCNPTNGKSRKSASGHPRIGQKSQNVLIFRIQTLRLPSALMVTTRECMCFCPFQPTNAPFPIDCGPGWASGMMVAFWEWRSMSE